MTGAFLSRSCNFCTRRYRTKRMDVSEFCSDFCRESNSAGKVPKKTCRSCSLPKEIGLFYRRTRRLVDGTNSVHLDAICNKCRNKKNYRNNPEKSFSAAKERHSQIKALVNSYKDKPCADCGDEFPLYVMDFDHRPGEEKIAGISSLVQFRVSIETLLKEIGKCDVVCANCHRIRTHSRLSQP